MAKFPTQFEKVEFVEQLSAQTLLMIFYNKSEAENWSELMEIEPHSFVVTSFESYSQIEFIFTNHDHDYVFPTSPVLTLKPPYQLQIVAQDNQRKRERIGFPFLVNPDPLN